MIINLSPQAGNSNTVITADSATQLTINGVIDDLSVIPVGGEAEGVSPLIGKVTRDEVTVLWQYDPRDTAYNGENLQPLDITVFPYTVDIADFIEVVI